MLKFLHESLGFLSSLFSKVLLNEQKRLRLSSFHGLLQLEHLIADIVANLGSPIFMLELLATAEFQDPLALLVSALLFPAPLVVLRNLGELD